MAEKAKGKKASASEKATKPEEKPEVEPTEKPEEKAAEKVEAKPTEKAKEKKPEKVKKKQKGAYTRYKVDATSLTRLRPYCERCGPGYFMADHGDRFACGHCGFTRYKRA